MGGGGVKIDFPRPVSTEELLKGASSDEEKASYETEVNLYFEALLSNFNNRNVEQIRTHLETIAGALSKDIEGKIDLIYGGSVAKHTYVDGLSDVDVLAIINETSLAETSPKAVLQYFAERFQERLPNTDIKVGKLAVTVMFADEHEIQVLPALSTKTGVRILDTTGTHWTDIVRPRAFARKLTHVNQSNSRRVVPAIKLFKSVNEQLPKDARMTGYHIESIAINAFENYRGRATYKDMLLHLSEHAVTAVLNPIKDRTGQSLHVDDYLGAAGSLERQKVSVALKRTVARMKLAESEASSETWRELMSE